jgi:hypothetical protein
VERKDLQSGNSSVNFADHAIPGPWKKLLRLPFFLKLVNCLVFCNVPFGDKYWRNLLSLFLFIGKQDWFKESKTGFKDSDMSNQCAHRFSFLFLILSITSDELHSSTVTL